MPHNLSSYLAFLLLFGMNMAEVFLGITRPNICSHEDNETNMLRQKDETMRGGTFSFNIRSGSYERRLKKDET
jgi:hypothetical protein